MPFIFLLVPFPPSLLGYLFYCAWLPQSSFLWPSLGNNYQLVIITFRTRHYPVVKESFQWITNAHLVELNNIYNKSFCSAGAWSSIRRFTLLSFKSIKFLIPVQTNSHPHYSLSICFRDKWWAICKFDQNDWRLWIIIILDTPPHHTSISYHVIHRQ